jgi:hypothetical protein
MIRTEQRRRYREQEALAMNTDHEPDAIDWTLLEPHLDRNLNELSEADRQAIVLRFFDKLDLRAAERWRGGDLAPILAGDFNFRAHEPQSASTAGYCKAVFDWLDFDVLCERQDGLEAITVPVQGNLMHAFVLKRCGAPNISRITKRLARLRFRYEADDAGAAKVPHGGIELPYIQHNVVALGLQIVEDPPATCAEGNYCHIRALGQALARRRFLMRRRSHRFDHLLRSPQNQIVGLESEDSSTRCSPGSSRYLSPDCILQPLRK